MMLRLLAVLIAMSLIAPVSSTDRRLTAADRSRLLPTLAYDVYEESPAGTVVSTQLPSDAGLTDRYTPDVQSLLRYIILHSQTDQSAAGYFQVDELSGWLRTNVVIDRELICRQMTTCVVRVNVAVQPARY